MVLAILAIGFLFSGAGLYLNSEALSPHLPLLFSTAYVSISSYLEFLKSKHIDEDVRKGVAQDLANHLEKFESGKQEIEKQLAELHSKMVFAEENIFPPNLPGRH